MMSGVLLWWIALCAFACVNITAWFYTAIWLKQQKRKYDPVVFRNRQYLLWLSAIYVFVCAFRSFLPRVDVLRISLVDSWLSSIFVGRSLATMAELSFMLELCLLIYLLGKSMNIRLPIYSAVLSVLLIVIAEVFSWYAVLTTNNFGHVIENSIWTIVSGLILISLIFMWPHTPVKIKSLIRWGCVFGVGYAAFMIFDNVPMYITRWQQDLASGKEYLSVGQGFYELFHQWTVTFEWSVWCNDVGWQTLYFSTAVWLSILLVYMPPFEKTNSIQANEDKVTSN